MARFPTPNLPVPYTDQTSNPSFVGCHNPNGSLNVSFVSGSTYVGAYAQNGSLNVTTEPLPGIRSSNGSLRVIVVGSNLYLNLTGQTSYEAETESLTARFTTPPTTDRKNQINSLIKSLKDAGIWIKIDCLWLTAAADSQAARQNWKQDLYNLTAVSSPVFTVDRGYKGDGAGAYLATGFNPSTAPTPNYGIGSALAGVWIGDLFSGGGQDIAAFDNTAVTHINTRTGANTAGGRLNTQTVSNFAVPTSIGLTCASRVLASEYQFYKNGVSLGTTAGVATAVPTNPFGVLAYNGGGDPSQRQVRAAVVGGGLTSGEHTAFYNALNTYLTAIGAA